jgi:two-component system, NtrC family, sensor kinase
MHTSEDWIQSVRRATWRGITRPALPIVVVSALLCLGAANIAARVQWHEVEDGVLWTAGAQGVAASEIAKGTAAARSGLKRGDLLLAIDDQPVQSVDDVIDALHRAEESPTLRYTILRLGTREVLDIRVAPVPNGPGALYFILAAVGIFTLLVGGAVRLRRPRDPATLHFFWLAVAFFGVFTFSFSGRLDRLDWVFFWADEISILALPPMFLHFTLVFPDRPRRWTGGQLGRVLAAVLYVPAVALGVARVLTVSRGESNGALFVWLTNTLDRYEFFYLGICLIGGLIGLLRAASQVRTITSRRQLRWIVWGTAFGAGPFAIGYALPYALGVSSTLPTELMAIPLSLIPLAYASAIVRYRLMDIEVIVKRTLVYAAALSAIVAMYAILLQLVERTFARGANNPWVLAFLATLVAVLLAPPIKDFVQNMLDRAFYRDRYDYRRALVGFARDLNSDLDLNRLAERLVSRVVETLLIDRMALMVEDEVAPHFGSVRSSGFGNTHPPALPQRSGIGARLLNGHVVALDDPIAVGRFAVEEIEFWRDAGLYYFVPCVAKEGTIAVLALGRKDTGEPLNSEDMGLLSAVAGQIATALENARLYRQLHLKAIELDRMRAFNENILESLDDGLLVLDLDDRIVRWNSALEQLYGVTREEAVSRRFDDVFDPLFVEAIRSARRDTPTGTTLSRMPLAGRAVKDGDQLTVNAAVVPLRAVDSSASSTIVGSIVIIEDVTARVQLEEQLQISEKMASIGLLAAGVAHEVNTPLTGISSFTQMLLEGADPDDPKTRLLEKIERQTFRAAKIVNGLLNLSRPAPAAASERAPVDLNTVITEVIALLEHQFEQHNVKVRRELSDEQVTVLGMEHKLQQVFLNLFLNARDAMPKGGWLSVTTRVEDGRMVAEVADTGAGIPNEYLSRIYDPFFTTKTLGQGTGLGLSITYGIVREHDGSIDCESVIGSGTRFILSFPPVRVERPALAVQQ